MRPITYYIALLGSLMPFFACKQPTKPAPIAIDSISDLHQHPNGKMFEFTGKAVTTLLGANEFSVHNHRRQQPTSMTWVVPVIDSDGVVDDVIHMWISPGYTTPGQHDPSQWFELIEREFNEKKQQLTVRSRYGERPNAGWEMAIRNAEKTHNVQSHSNAAIILWPKDRPK